MISYRNMNKVKADRIRELYFNKYYRYTQNELSEMFSISQGNICRILKGEVWN